MAHERMIAFNKKHLNRRLRKLALLSRGPFALIWHVGRKSGQTYETPIIVEPLNDGFVVALTYGPTVDWYRNVSAARHAKLHWHKRDYVLEGPEPVERAIGLSAFPAPLRAVLQLRKTLDFVYFRQRIDE